VQPLLQINRDAFSVQNKTAETTGNSMLLFILRRFAVMVFTALCLTFIVFFMTNLYPNLEKLAKSEGNFRMDDAAVASFLDNRGYLDPLPIKYGRWLGVLPGYVIEGSDGKTRGQCFERGTDGKGAPRFCGVLQGNWGFSTVFKDDVGQHCCHTPEPDRRFDVLGYGPHDSTALVLGVVAGMREGSRTDRTLSTVAITTTATPEYVSGVIFIAFFHPRPLD
jgi:peptide/nickel transport system permease protein